MGESAKSLFLVSKRAIIINHNNIAGAASCFEAGLGGMIVAVKGLPMEKEINVGVEVTDVGLN